MELVDIMTTTVNQNDINKFLYQLYQDVSPATISIGCRKKLGIYNQYSFIYGESYLPSLYKIFDEVKPKEGEVFYDLGSGSGRVVLFAALNFPFAEVIGVELLDDLFDLSQKKLELLYKRLPNLPNFNINNVGKINFIHDDFTKINFKKADIIYIASTCFEEKLMRNLAKFLAEQVKVGTRIITCTKHLPSKSFKINKSKLHPMEWGQVTIFFQEKI
jgi:SAM-dependent methyltransferase